MTSRSQDKLDQAKKEVSGNAEAIAADILNEQSML